jgi:predicted small secreted protein
MAIFQLLAFFFKNMALVLGVVEAIIKLIAGIVSRTPTKKDDKFLKGVNKAFSQLKKWCYDLSDSFIQTKKEIKEIKDKINKEVVQ